VPVPGASGYEVSNRGGFRSVDRLSADGRRLKGKPLKPVTTSTVPYPAVKYTLDSGGQTNPRCVHVIELEAFTGPCPPGMEACHLDDVSAHNCLENLRWDTPEGNLADRLRNKPQRMCVRCETRPVTRGGKRCHDCVVEIGKAATPLLQDGVPLGKACAMLDYPSPEGLHTLARKYGGYGQRPQASRPRSVTALAATLRDRIGWRHHA
jgi:HNH endonuclease/NUMOD4 motif